MKIPSKMQLIYYELFRRFSFSKTLYTTVFFLFFFFIANGVFGQNLIPNAGFENFSSFPADESGVHLLKGWSNPSTSDEVYPKGSPDYLHAQGSGAAKLPNSYFGKVHPYRGEGIIGIMTYNSWASNFREYVSIKLKNKLIPGQKYQLSFYFTNGSENQYSAFGSNKLGAHFSEKSVIQQGHDPINLTPQVEANRILYSSSWQRVEFEFTAKEEFTYVTLGNFHYDHDTQFKKFSNSGGKSSYYFIDEVMLIPVDLSNQLALELENEIKKPEKLKERTVAKQESFKVKSKELQVKIWDSKKIDGDMVSLKFNGEWILKKYTVKKTPKIISLTIDPEQDNYLILYAHNLGTDPPNTAAISFKDRGREHRVVLSSDLSTCGAIELLPIDHTMFGNTTAGK